MCAQAQRGGTPSKANNECDGYFVLICCPPTFDQYLCKAATAQYDNSRLPMYFCIVMGLKFCELFDGFKAGTNLVRVENANPQKLLNCLFVHTYTHINSNRKTFSLKFQISKRENQD